MRFFISTFLFFCMMLCTAQNNKPSPVKHDSLSNQSKVKKSRFVIFPGCETEEDKYECYANKLQDFITDAMSNEAKEHLALHAENDTIVLYANIKYDKNGEKIPSKSRLKSFVKDFDPYLIPIKNSLPKVEPALDYKGNPNSNSVAYTLGFLVNKKNVSITPLYGYQPPLKPKQIRSFAVIENTPIYRGCEREKGNTKKKQCMSQKIALLFKNNFNTIIPEKSSLSPGLVSVLVMFKIDENGNIKDINVKAEDDYLVKESIRVTKLIPDLKPGHVRGKPVTVPYTLPLRINLEARKVKATYPVYRGCHKEINYEDTKKCTTDKIADYIKVSFDYRMADRVFPTAESTSFQVDFLINEKGKTEHVNAKANHKAIAIEAIRLIKRMPKLKQPGTENGKAVKTPISLLMTVNF